MSSRLSLLTISEFEDTVGSDALADTLARFSCPLNKEVESYLKDSSRAVQSSQMSSSVTYLAFDSRSNDLLGYFTLMMKAYSVKSDALNSANKRLIRRFSEIDSSGNFTAAVYLIAQIGKNFALPEEDQIEGSELLMAAMNVFCETKKAIGGKLVMVEREADRPKLLEFYNDNGFKSWTTRRNAKDGMVYDQMFAVLGGK
jgi:hypothetical protein